MKTFWKHSLTLLVLVGVATQFASANVPVLFYQGFKYKINVKPGDVYRFNMKSETSMGGTTTLMNAIIRLEITKVEDKKTTIISKYESFEMGGDMPDFVSNMMKNLKVTFVLDESGRQISIKVDGAPGPMGDMIAQQMKLTIPFPDKTMTPGESWEHEDTVMGQKVKTKYTYKAMGKYKDKEAAVIEFTTPGMMGAPPGKATMWIEPDTGMMYKMEMNTEFTNPGGNSKVLIERTD